MGDGLKRAAAAAARTRADASLTPEMRAFLDLLAPHSKPMTRKALGCVTSEAEERARGACRRLGYAKFHRLTPFDPVGWSITAAGRRARNAPTPSDPSPSRVEEG